MALDATKHTVTAYFKKRSEAEDAVEALKDANFSSSQISLAVRPEYGTTAGTDAYQAGQTAGEKTRSVWDSVVNFFEGNSDDKDSSRTQFGTGSSQVAGEPVHDGYDYDPEGFQGSIKKLNVPEENARYFNHHFGQGEEGALVTVAAAGREAEAESILEQCQGDVGRGAAGFAYPATREASAPQGTQRVQLLGEILKVHKERVQSGEVTIRKNVITESKTFEVPVTREELVITRNAVSGGASTPAGSIGEDSEIRIPLSEEQVYLEKKNVVLEEVSVGTRTVTGSQALTGSIRHEELEIDEGGMKDDLATTDPRY